MMSEVKTNLLKDVKARKFATFPPHFMHFMPHASSFSCALKMKKILNQKIKKKIFISRLKIPSGHL